MLTLQIQYTRGEESVTIEYSRRGNFGQVIRAINALDIDTVVNSAPEEVCYPDKISITVINGTKAYTRSFDDIVYSCGIVTFGYRDPEALSYFWDKL